MSRILPRGSSGHNIFPLSLIPSMPCCILNSHPTTISGISIILYFAEVRISNYNFIYKYFYSCSYTGAVKERPVLLFVA